MSQLPTSSDQPQEDNRAGGVVNQITPLLSSCLILSFYAVLTLILTYPLIFNLTQAVPSDIGDPLLNTWILAWDSYALLTDPLALFNANIFYPLPNTLAYSEHLLSTAFLVLPFQVIFAEPVLAYNLSLLFPFPLAAFGMYLLAFRWTHSRRAAFIAGLIFGFAPYRFSAIAHLQLLTFQWLPFALLFIDKIAICQGQRSDSRPLTHSTGSGRAADPFDRLPTIAGLRRAGRRPPQKHLRFNACQLRFGLAFVIFLVFQILASWYLALYTALILGLYIGIGFLSRRFSLTQLPVLAALFLLTFGLILPFALPYAGIVNELSQARPLSLALSLAAQPADFLAAAPSHRLFGPLTAPFRSRPGFTEENTIFLGLVAPLLALAMILSLIIHSLKRLIQPLSPLPSPLPTPYSLLPTSYSLLLILILSLSLTFPAPYAGLANLLPVASVVRVPPRWVIPALFALAGLAAFGYTLINAQLARNTVQVINFAKLSTTYTLRTTPYALRFTFYFTCLLLLLEAFSMPIPLASIQNHHQLNPAYDWLADQARTAQVALVELPLHSAPAPEYPEVKRLYASTLGWWRLVNGYSGYTPPRQGQLAQALAVFPDQPAIDSLQLLTTNNQSPTTPSPSSPISLYLLIHPGEAPLDRTRWETVDRWRAERNPALLPLGQFEGDYLYQVFPPRFNHFVGPSLATFGQNQKIQLLELKLDHEPRRSAPYTPRLRLFWQPTTPLLTNYTVFIHLRASDGFVRSQADGPPVGGHYPTGAWQPGEIIQDIHLLPPEDFSQVDHLAIGLYDPATGERLPAFDPAGTRLADDALIIPLP